MDLQVIYSILFLSSPINAACCVIRRLRLMYWICKWFVVCVGLRTFRPLHRRSVDVLSFVVCWLQPWFSHERAYDRELCKERWTLVLDANAYLSFRLFSRLISATTLFKERLLGRSVVSKALSLRMLDAFGWLCATTISLIVVIFHIQQVPSKLCLLRLF